MRSPPSASAAEGSLAVACPLAPRITTAPISPPPGLSQVDHMADGVTASTSPGGATPSLKNDPGELADEGEPVSERLAKDAETQAFKMRELERSRFREVVQRRVGVDTEAVIPAMLYAARADLPKFPGGIALELLPWPPSHGDNMVKQLLKDAHRRSLWAPKLAEAAREDLPAVFVENIRTEFTNVLSDIPQTCWDKYGPNTMDTQANRAAMVLGLIKKHSGNLSNWIVSLRAGICAVWRQALPSMNCRRI